MRRSAAFESAARGIARVQFRGGCRFRPAESSTSRIEKDASGRLRGSVRHFPAPHSQRPDWGAGKWLWWRAMMEAVVQVEKAGRNRQLTERDRELCGFLAVCRYLTREQIERLMFAGRSKARSSTRLRQLAKKTGGQEALLRGDLGYGSAEGWTTVWALTAEGFEVGSQHVGLKLERMPKQDVGQAFLKHEVMANEVFLGLVPQDGKTWAKVPREFRWILGEYLDLSFEEYSHAFPSKLERHRLQPDAILEIPSSRRRFFIEYETGSATVRDAKKSTSTMAKLDRYGNFLCAPVGRVLDGERKTAYSRAFPDRWPPEVLFVTRTEARRDLIAAV